MQPTSLRAIARATIVVLWAILVAIGVASHVYWRDEVRALTLATEAPNLWSVPAFVHGEGHPALWYVLLRGAHDVLHVREVLPFLAVFFAAAAVVLLVYRSPLALWLTALFIFTWPIYEYSVSDRNYGIAMALMFAIAACLAATRRRYVAIALLLALLAQTNMHAMLLVPFFIAIIATDGSRRTRHDRTSTIFCAIVAFVACAAAVATVYPTRHDLIAGTIARPTLATLSSFLVPGAWLTDERKIDYRAIQTSVLLYGSCAILLPDLVLFTCAIVALWMLSVFAIAVYPLSFRHVGVWASFLIALAWIRYARASNGAYAARDTTRRAIIGHRIAMGAFVFLLVSYALIEARTIVSTTRHPASDSRSLAMMIATDPRLHGAILLPEPEEYGEALPYYIDNPVYLAREHRFGRTATWSRTTQIRLTLGQLLDDAHDLRRREGKPVVIVIAETLKPRSANVPVSLGWRFAYAPADVRRLRRETTELPGLRRGFLESFDAYVVR